MPLGFIQNSVVHRGFVRYSRPNDIDFRNHRLVVAWFDGEPDLWLVENTDTYDGFENLKAYYTADWGPDRVIYQSFTMLP